MRRIALVLLLLASAVCVLAQPVVISDTLRYPSGAPWTGTLRISWTNAFIGGDGSRIGPPSVPIIVSVGPSGVFSVTLQATTTATPITNGRPVFYSVTYQPARTATNPEVWVVPYRASPLNLAAIVASGPPVTSTINPSQLSAFGAAMGDCLNWNGSVALWGTCGTFSGITSLNGLSANSQTFARVNDTNITLAIASVGSTHTFTVGWQDRLSPARGGTGTSTPFTQGSVVFAGSSGIYTQDNPNLFWDATNHRLGIGTNTPATTLSVVSPTSSDAQITLDNRDGTHQSALVYNSGGVQKYQLSSRADGSFGLLDVARSKDSWSVNPNGVLDLQPTSGNVVVGGTVDAGYSLAVERSSGTGTALFFDKTASTGITNLVLQLGEGQGGFSPVNVVNNAGSLLGGITVEGGAFIASGSTVISQLRTNGFEANNASFYAFSSTNQSYQTADAALYRNAAGIVEIDNGTPGTYRDLITRNQTIGALNNAVGIYRLDVQSSGSTGTVQIYDRTPSSGNTFVLERAGAGQATVLEQWQDNSGTVLSQIDRFGGLGTYSGGIQKTSTVANIYQMSSDSSVQWKSATNVATGAVDLALFRNAAGILEIDSGASGTYRDLILRNITVTGNCFGAGCGGSGSVGTPPYSTTTITGSPMTILAATHGQGQHAYGVCWDASTNPQVMETCKWTRNPSTGDLILSYDTAPGQIEIFGATGGFANPMTNEGDLMYEHNTIATRLPVGTNNQCILSNGTDPAWSSSCGLTGSPLSQFAATTSAQLAGVLSDETGTGVAVFSASPTLTGTLTAAAANFSGVVAEALGQKYTCTHGANATCGVVALSSGTATVSTTAVAALAAAGAAGNALSLTLQSCSSCGTLSVGTVSAGTSFVINSTNVADASNVFWEIRNVL